MLYQPKFCCQCGEKIDGTDRKFWTSRRFCKLCATEVGLYERVPQIFGAIILAVGLLGIGINLQKPSKQLQIVPNQTASANVKSDVVPPRTVAQVSAASRVQNAVPVINPASPTSALPKSDLKTEPTAASEPPPKVYFCGAPTKKGTMCSRRIKNGGRCWQHEGQAAMMAQEKLLAVR